MKFTNNHSTKNKTTPHKQNVVFRHEFCHSTVKFSNLEENMKYKNINWDWNGTIVDDAYLCVEVMNQVLKNKDLPLTLISV